jgi:hypothetical protein
LKTSQETQNVLIVRNMASINCVLVGDGEAKKVGLSFFFHTITRMGLSQSDRVINVVHYKQISAGICQDGALMIQLLTFAHNRQISVSGFRQFQGDYQCWRETVYTRPF